MKVEITASRSGSPRTRLLALLVAGAVLEGSACLGGVLVDLDATQLPTGALNTWTNKGSVAGDFTSAGTTVPQVAKIMVGKGVTFSSTAHYVGPAAPAAVTGNGSRTVEAWVYDPSPQDEKTVFGWGRRGDDSRNCSFNHGTSADYGAVGHWGGADIGWDGNLVFGQWTYIVYTYDGDAQTTTVYKDGEFAASETLSSGLDTWAVDNTANANPLPFRVARQNDANGAASATGVGDITIGKIRVHDVALTAEDIKAKFDEEVLLFKEKDSDNDGIPDWWEEQYAFMNKADATDATKDQDSDGLTNLEEFTNKTLPDNADTDGDGLKDGAEIKRTPAPTNPLKADTDDDGLSDAVETGTGAYKSPQDTGSDPVKADTDNDGFLDGQEVFEGADPNVATSKPTGNPALVLLDATQLPEGPVASWKNTGVLPGDFAARDAGAAPSVVTELGVKGIQFDGAEYYTGPTAPLWITGNGAHSIEAWVFNPALADEETVFSWGRRGGPDGSNSSFNHGLNADYGAVGHWGSPDIGWGGNTAAGTWTHIAYTWSPIDLIENVYKDGELASTESLVAELGIAYTNSAGVPLPFRIASQNEANGAPTEGLRGSMTIAKITVYDTTLSDAQVKQHFTTDAATFGVLDDDQDGMPTWYERKYAFLNPNDATDAAKDQDNDGLTNLEEYQNKTLPDNPDSDGDGATDGAEVKTLHTKPFVTDTDQDGLSDSLEAAAGTDPLLADSDGDTFADGLEVARGSNPTLASSMPAFTDPVAMIDLDAGNLPLGPLAVWLNVGAMQGKFFASDPPAKVEVVAGAQGVTFDGTQIYTGLTTPLWLAANSARTIEAWVYNLEIADEENIFSWGRRGGPDGSNCSFNHGGNGTWGAVGQWGGADIGWNGKITAAQWNHVVYTWEPTTTTGIVYSDGQPATTNVFTAGLNTFAVNDTPDPDAVPLPFRVAGQNDANGAPTEGLRGSMTIARIRVYDTALSPSVVAARYNSEVGRFTTLQISGFAYNATADTFTLTWQAAAGAQYDVLASSDVATGWSTVASGLTVGTFTEKPSVAGAARFYQVKRR